MNDDGDVAKTADLDEAASRFVRWMDEWLLIEGRGDHTFQSINKPKGRFWLGRLAPEESLSGVSDERAERMEPCAVGIRILPTGLSPWTIRGSVSACAWERVGKGESAVWNKTPRFEGDFAISLKSSDTVVETPVNSLNEALASRTGTSDLRVLIRTEVSETPAGERELSIFAVNASPEESPNLDDTNLYEVSLQISEPSTTPFVLEALPDSFRYDRKVPAYGVNCGVEVSSRGFSTTDTVVAERYRPDYSNSFAKSLSFSELAADPLPLLGELADAHALWGESAWSDSELFQREVADTWSTAMAAQAREAAAEFAEENIRLRRGLDLLVDNPDLLSAFRLMNGAMLHSGKIRGYESWRSFQVGFLLSALGSLIDLEEAELVDVLFFATGGGKTETYMGLLILAAFFDRITGKTSGITAWCRFPLRMLSAQQTQRFADAFAGAELVRIAEGIAGDPFAVGFLVGEQGTPNSIQLDPDEGKPNPDDPAMPKRFQVLRACPFCHDEDIQMEFDRERWRLVHVCSNRSCPWPEHALPFFVVDDEVFRFLPTVVIGTLDKAASISTQSKMRGLVGAPHGVCSVAGHGFTYAPRSKTPAGCAVPGCRGNRQALPMDSSRFAPRFRLQDELHLLRDSLGAVDTHYESLLDHLQEIGGGQRSKVVASSATLSGVDRQCQVLYRRQHRLFPTPGPTSTSSFWSLETSRLLRRFVAVAPRGETVDFAAQRTVTELQAAVRKLMTEPENVCAELNIALELAPKLLSLYGTDVVYGNTIRDLEATVRSMDTQVPFSPLTTESLTGHTPFSDVLQILNRLENPEADFDDRIHIVAASSMMSHGVDIDRLNVMVMLGMPLTTAEFIQTTARIGRKHPGLVVVLQRMGRERDASIYRSFKSFVEQGDRFVEAIPITRRSRRVLMRTLAGLEMARIVQHHEPRSGQALSTIPKLRDWFRSTGVTPEGEQEQLRSMLGIGGPDDHGLDADLTVWVREFFRNLDVPPDGAKFPSDLSPSGKPMMSLRDVEEQAPVRD